MKECVLCGIIVMNDEEHRCHRLVDAPPENTSLELLDLLIPAIEPILR